MNWHQINLYSYSRSFRKPLRLGSHTLEERRGFYLDAVDASGRRHAAECAPLPGLHQESSEELEQAWRELAGSFSQAPLDWQRWQFDRPYWGLLAWPEQKSPVLQLSIEMLLLSLAFAERPQIFPRAALTDSYEHSALLYLPATADAAWWQRLHDLRERGLRVLKVKIGRQAPQVEQQRLTEIRSVWGDHFRLRLDGNRALNAAVAQSWLNFLPGWPVDYIEEPTADPETLALFAGRWPLARDESLWGIEPSMAAAQHKVLILKPNTLGLSRYVAWLLAADAVGGSAVLSNSYESSLSLQLYTWLYGCIVRKPLALGLGTMDAFAGEDFASEISFDHSSGAWPQRPLSELGTWPGLFRKEQIWPH